MPERSQSNRPHETRPQQQVETEEKSLLGSSWSYVDHAETSDDTAKDFATGDNDD